MLERYFELKGFLEIIALQNKDIVPLLLSPLENQSLTVLLQGFREMHVMSIVLQRKSPAPTLPDIRIGFDFI